MELSPAAVESDVIEEVWTRILVEIMDLGLEGFITLMV